MPYIPQADRERLDSEHVYGYPNPQTPGELAYVIWQVLRNYTDVRSERYSTFAEIEGVLGTVQKHWWYRFGEPYEADRWSENGDVL